MSYQLLITCSTIAEGTEEWDWLQARTAYVAGEQPLCVTVMNKARNSFTHDYCDIFQTISRDGGMTWSEPDPIVSLRRANLR